MTSSTQSQPHNQLYAIEYAIECHVPAIFHTYETATAMLRPYSWEEESLCLYV